MLSLHTVEKLECSRDRAGARGPASICGMLVPYPGPGLACRHTVLSNTPFRRGTDVILFTGQWSSWLHSARNPGLFPRNNALPKGR